MTLSEKLAIVISPHQDDFAFSVANHVINSYERVKVFNIFTRSSSHVLDGIPDNEDLVSALRYAEDRRFSTIFPNVEFSDAGFPDCEIRGITWDDHQSNVDSELLSKVSAWVSGQLHQIMEPFSIYIPAAFGLHPDHYLVLRSFEASYLLESIRHMRIVLYGEQPYFVEGKGFHYGHYNLGWGEEFQSLWFDRDRKRAMLVCYPSQATTERAEKILNVGYEYIWDVSAEFMEQFLKMSLLREKWNVGHFGDPMWVELNEEAYKAKDIEFTSYKVENEAGGMIDIPLAIQRLRIPTLPEPILAARLANVYTSDYFDFLGIDGFDNRAFWMLCQKLFLSDVDVIWWSKIIKNSRIGRLIEGIVDITDARMWDGIPSVGVVTSRTYEEWIASLGKETKRNIYRKLRKLSLASGKHTVEWRLVNSTERTVQVLVDLQSHRAAMEGVRLEQVSLDTEFCRFVNSLVDKSNILSAELLVGREVISSLLVLNDEARKSMAIYLQGLAPDWARYSPSFCNIIELIKYAHMEGYRYVDFLRGNEQYKNHFAKITIPQAKFLFPLRSSLHLEHIVDHVKNYEE